MEWETITVSGDTWDLLALNLYGTEKLAWVLQKANPQYLPLILLPAGLKLRVPPKPAGYDARPAAPWTRRLTEAAL